MEVLSFSGHCQQNSKGGFYETQAFVLSYRRSYFVCRLTAGKGKGLLRLIRELEGCFVFPVRSRTGLAALWLIVQISRQKETISGVLLLKLYVKAYSEQIGAGEYCTE